MPVWSLTNPLRVLVTLLAVTGLAGLSLAAYAQQEPPKKPAAQPQKPPPKPRAPAATTAKPAPKEPAAPKVESLPPSQVGIGTLARHAFMVDPQTSTVLLFKDAETPMAPSSGWATCVRRRAVCSTPFAQCSRRPVGASRTSR